MRVPKYLSPSSIKTFNNNRDEFYLKYLAANRPERLPQTRPMSVGSAFDAYIKSFLHHRLMGNYGPNNEYARDTIFEKQVEPHNRDFAGPAGEHVFQRYCDSGACVDLMGELQKSVGPPRFEFDITGFIEGRIIEVPMTGKPDIFFINAEGARVILDWKVNGYCGNSPTSPRPGYVKCRDTWKAAEGKKLSKNNMMAHKDCFPEPYKGMIINPRIGMENVDIDWANQLSVYSWLLGEEVGSTDLIIGIDQIVGQPGPDKPWLRIANHRCRIGSEYQIQLHQRIQEIWNVIQTGHIFEDLSREDSDRRCHELDELARGLSSEDDLARFVNQVSRSQ